MVDNIIAQAGVSRRVRYERNFIEERFSRRARAARKTSNLNKYGEKRTSNETRRWARETGVVSLRGGGKASPWDSRRGIQ